uniref:Opioid binding protein/cell adhesion molecule-like n=1 Tax=Mastacembelus armatus TaxID=205130 RepID=A0A3Q3KX85_9TELE
CILIHPIWNAIGPRVPARITNISKDITVNEGSNVNLMCLAVGRPEANIVWKHHSPRGTHKFVTEGENLELTAITKEQSGTYECIASNDISSPDVRTVEVTINYPPFISKARSMGTSVGQKGVLQCEASAVPRADFEWYKEDRRQVFPLKTQGKQSMLIFFNVSEEDYGNYTCVATNIMGITNASIILYVQLEGCRSKSSSGSPLVSFLFNFWLCIRVCSLLAHQE